MGRPELSKNSKFYISGNLYKQCVYFCRQYPEWEMELKTAPDAVRAITYDNDRVQSGGDSDSTSVLAMRRYLITQKKALVDDTLTESDIPELFKPWVLLGVTTDCTVWEMIEKGMPLSKNTYYKYRRLFFYNLSKKM